MKTYTLEEMKALAAEKGMEWTPGLESELRSRGAIVDAPKIDIGKRVDLAALFSGIPGVGPAVAANVRSGDIENPVTNAIRGAIEAGSLGYYDPLAGEPWGTSVKARVGRGFGMGGATAAQFAVTAPLVAPLQALSAGRFIAPAAQFGALGVARALPHGNPGPGGEEPQPQGIMDQVVARLKAGGQEAVIGAGLAGMHFLPELIRNPAVREVAKKVMTSLPADIAMIGGMDAVQQARQGDVNWGEVATNAIPFALGQRFGNAAAHAVNPKMGMNAQQREEYDARELAQRIAAQRGDAARVEAERQAAMQADVENRQKVFDEARQWREAEMAGNRQWQTEQDNQAALAAWQAQREAEFRAQQEAAPERQQAAQDAFYEAMDATRDPERAYVRRILGPMLNQPLALPPGTTPTTELGTIAVTPEGTAMLPQQRPRVPMPGTTRPAPEPTPSRLEPTPPTVLDGQRPGPAPQLPKWEAPQPPLPTEPGVMFDQYGAPHATVGREAPRPRPVEPGQETTNPYTDTSGQLLNPFGKPARRGRDINLNTIGGQDIYESLKRMSDRAGDRRRANSAAREQRVRALAEQMVDAAERGQPIAGFEEYQAALGIAPRREDQTSGKGKSGFYRDPSTGRMMRAYIDGEPNSIPLVDYLNGKIDEVAVARAAADMNGPSAQLIRQILQEGKVGKLNPHAVQVTDRGRTLRAAGKGEFMNPIQQHTQGVGRLAEMVRERMEFNLSKEYLEALTSHGLTRKNPDSGVFADISQLATDTGVHPRELAKTPDGAKIMAQAQNPEAIYNTFDAVQKVEAKLGDIMNSGRVVAGEKPITLRTYHMARVEKQYSLLGRGGRDFLNALEQRTRPRDTSVQAVGPNDVWSAREQKRGKPLLGPDQISRDPFYIAEQYVRDVARTFTGRVGMRQGENVAELVRQLAKQTADPIEAGQLLQTADAISAITQMAYNGKLIGIAGSTRDLLESGRGGQLVRIGDQMISRIFNQSRYIFNIRFMLGTQWTSVLMAAGQDRVTPDMFLRASREVLSKRLRDEYNLSYAHWAKTRNASSIIHENDMTAGAIRNPLRDAGRSRVAKAGSSVLSAASAPTRGIEDYVGRFAYALGEQIGIKAGFTGEKLDAFKSSTVELTQSLFDRANRAALLSTPLLRTAMPAQGYNFDYWNTNLFDIRRGQLGPKSNMTKAQKAEAISRVVFLQMMSNAIYAMFGSREESAAGKLKDAAWGATGGSIPYLSQGLGLTFSKGRGFQAQWVEENVKAIKYAYDGDMDRALSTAVVNLLPGGLQESRYLEAQQKVNEGVIPKREQILGSAFGWEWTPSGRRYLRRQSGKETARDRAYIPDAEQERKAEEYRYQQSIKAEEKAAKKQAERDRQDEEYYRRGGR